MKNIRLSLIALFLSLASLSQAQVADQIVPLQRNNTGNVAGGYIFITQTTLDSTGTYPSAISLLDSVGRPVFFRSFPNEASAPYTPAGISDFKLQPSGLFSFSGKMANGENGMYLMDSSFMIVDSISCTNGVSTDGHDLIHLPDGSYHLVGTEERIMDLSGILTQSGTPGDTDATVIDNVIQRFDAQKNLEFEWRALDHFALSDVYAHFFTDPGLLDHSHYNSIEIDTDGNYLLSFRHLHEITKVDASSGQIIWRLGGKNNQFSFLGDTMKFSAQHDARRIANGNLTLFDNGDYNSTPTARAIEYQLDEGNMTITDVWQFSEPNGISSKFIGNAQRLPNGNTLIDWGGAFPLSQSTSFTEVDAAGNIIMELDFLPDNYVSYRAVKHKLPFAIQRPEVICNARDTTLTAPAGHASYSWNTGDTAQSISIKDTGTYQVWVNYGTGFISSKAVHVSDLTDICNFTNLHENNQPDINFYPNPVLDELIIEYTGKNSKKVQIFAPSGQLVDELKISSGINSTNRLHVGHLSPGLYILKSGNSSAKFVKL